jgi:hypothetical protein
VSVLGREFSIDHIIASIGSFLGRSADFHIVPGVQQRCIAPCWDHLDMHTHASVACFRIYRQAIATWGARQTLVVLCKDSGDDIVC